MSREPKFVDRRTIFSDQGAPCYQYVVKWSALALRDSQQKACALIYVDYCSLERAGRSGKGIIF